MKLYLETVDFDEFIEINQYIPLDGALLSADLLIHDPAITSPSQAACKLLEAMTEEQVILVPVLQSGFRAMLAVCRDLKRISDQIVCLLPPSPDGYMVMKACSQQNIRTAAWNVLSTDQALFADRNQASLLLADLEQVSRLQTPEQFLQDAEKTLPEAFSSSLTVSGLKSPALFRTVLASGCAGAAAGYELFKELLLNQQTMQYQMQVMQEWTEKELLQDDPQTQPEPDPAGFTD